MCTYTAHIRNCHACGDEETVLISENVCQEAKKSGTFGDCGTEPKSERNTTEYQCWKCKEKVESRSRIKVDGGTKSWNV